MSNKVTYIEDLFDLDDVQPEQQSMQGHPQRMSQSFGRQMDNEISERETVSKPLQGKIRQHYDHRMAANGGASYATPQPTNGYPSHPGHPAHPGHHNSHNAPSPYYPQDYLLVEQNTSRHTQHPGHSQHEDDEFEMGPRVQRRGNSGMSGNSGNVGMAGIPHDPQSFRCIDVARHIKHCPICIKFYDNDRSLYIIIIIILAIICIILLKKLLENMKPSRGE